MFNIVGGDMLIKLEGFAYLHVDLLITLIVPCKNIPKKCLSQVIKVGITSNGTSDIMYFLMGCRGKDTI